MMLNQPKKITSLLSMCKIMTGDLDGDALTTEILDSTNSGTLILLNGDSIQFTPDANFNGKDTLSYRICDNGSPVLCDTANGDFYCWGN